MSPDPFVPVRLETQEDDWPGRIEALLAASEAALKLRVVVHDRAGVLRSPTGQSLLRAKHWRHTNDYCEFGRFTEPDWDDRCLSHCQWAVNAHALKTGGPFLHRCWKGAAELVVPVFRDGQHQLTLFGGVLRAACAPDIPVLKGKWSALPSVTARSMDSAVPVLRAVGDHLLALLDECHRFHTESDRRTQIRRFIHYNAHRQIQLADLAQALFLSTSRTRHLVKELFGIPFQMLVLNERIERARVLLSTSRVPLSAVAERVGFSSEYYFSRAFRKAVGEPPGQFRGRKAPT